MPNRRSFILAGVAIGLAGCLGDRDDTVDHRGDIAIIVDGDPVDLSKDRYQAEHADDYAMSFHFHESSDQWYNEGDGPITLADGLDKLPEFSFEMTDDGAVLTIDDEIYDAREGGVSIRTLVNEEEIDPTTYELADSDTIMIEISTGEGT